MTENLRLYNKKMGWKYLLLALISFVAILEELLLDRNLIKTFPIIFLMFIL